jgi:hypothetical protein
MKIRSVGAELFRADGETDIHGEVTSRKFSNAPKTHEMLPDMAVVCTSMRPLI